MNRFLILIISALLVWCSPVLGADTAKKVMTYKLAKPLTVKQFKPVTAVKIRKPLKFKLLRPLVPPKPVKPEGPDPKSAVDLSDMINDTALLEDLAFTCGWDPHLIFQDKAAGNVFYYLPRAFLLVHNENTGYGLNVQYNHLKGEGGASVMMTAELAAPHHTGDIQLLKSILKQAFELKPGDKLTLKSISGIGAAADMEGMTAGLSVPPERINLTLPSHLKKAFRLTLSLTPDETEEVLAQVSREGISGNLNVKVGEELVPVPIHIQYLNFSGTRVDGFQQWADNRPIGKIRNITRFPLQMESINGYKVTAGKLERISKKLKPSTLLPGRKKSFRLPPVSKVLGSNIMIAWLGTQIDADCADCIKTVDKQVRKGVATASGNPVKFEAIPMVFSDFELYKIIVQVQSPYFNAEPGKVEIREAELTEENNIHKDLAIYQPDGKGAEPLLFKYRLKLITAEGKLVVEDKWNDSRTLSRFFGASQIEPLLEPGNEDSIQ